MSFFCIQIIHRFFNKFKKELKLSCRIPRWCNIYIYLPKNMLKSTYIYIYIYILHIYLPKKHQYWLWRIISCAFVWFMRDSLFEIFYEICQAYVCYNWCITYADRGGLEASTWEKNDSRGMSCRMVQQYSRRDTRWIVSAFV
jgi:hypothetical protein